MNKRTPTEFPPRYHDNTLVNRDFPYLKKFQRRSESKSYHLSVCPLFLGTTSLRFHIPPRPNTNTFCQQPNIYSANICFTYTHAHTHIYTYYTDWYYFLTRMLTNFWTCGLFRPQHNKAKNYIVNSKFLYVYKCIIISVWFFSNLQKVHFFRLFSLICVYLWTGYTDIFSSF